MNQLHKFTICALAFFFTVSAQAQLSIKETERLAATVRMQYEEWGIEGAKVYQTSSHWTLVSIVTVTSNQKTSQQNRLAQIKASRVAIEFLKGSTNRSISVYDAFSTEGNSLTGRNQTGVNQKNQEIASSTSTSANEQTTNVESETMSDKVVQSAIDNIDGLQPLLKFAGEDGEIVYAYYMVISKHKAKKKR